MGVFMGSSNGTYVPWHEPVWSHAKTKAAAAVLTDHPKAPVPPQYAPAVVGRALHALSCWAIRDGDTGSTARLTDAELAQIAWPEGVACGRMKPATLGALLRQALHAGGFLELADGEERIHDFRDHNRRVLADREYRRLKAEQKAANKAGNRPTVGRLSDDSRTPIGPTRARQAQEAQEAREAERLGGLEAHPEARAPDPDRGFSTTPQSPQVEPPTGRSPRLDAGPGLPAAADAPVQPLDMASVAHALELRIGCSYQQAAKAVQVVQAAGASLEWIRERVMASKPPKAPWEWQNEAAEALASKSGRSKVLELMSGAAERLRGRS